LCVSCEEEKKSFVKNQERTTTTPTNMASRRAGANQEVASTVFLPSAPVKPVSRMEMICSSVYQQGGPLDPVRQYKIHPHFNEFGVASGGKPEGVCCWNCLHPYEGDGVFLALPESRVGFFCGVACRKRWEIEHLPLNPQIQYNMYQQSTGKIIKPALPQLRLKMLGGDLTIEEYRLLSNSGEVDCVVQMPPFVTWSMVFEERRKQPVPIPSTVPVSTANVAPLQPQPSAIAPVVIAFPNLQNEKSNVCNIRGIKVPQEPGQMEIMDPDAQPMPMFEDFLKRKQEVTEEKKDTSGFVLPPLLIPPIPPPPPPVPAPRQKLIGSSMKPLTKKAKKEPVEKTKKKTTTTQTSSANLQIDMSKVNPTMSAPTPSTDPVKGTLKAFMKQISDRKAIKPTSVSESKNPS
jgi:hypothetical protein